MTPTLIKHQARHVGKLVTSLDHGHSMMDGYSQTYHKSRFHWMARLGVRCVGRHTELGLEMQLGGPKIRAHSGAHSQNCSMWVWPSPFKVMLRDRFGKELSNFVMRQHLIVWQCGSHSPWGKKRGWGSALGETSCMNVACLCKALGHSQLQCQDTMTQKARSGDSEDQWTHFGNGDAQGAEGHGIRRDRLASTIIIHLSGGVGENERMLEVVEKSGEGWASFISARRTVVGRLFGGTPFPNRVALSPTQPHQTWTGKCSTGTETGVGFTRTEIIIVKCHLIREEFNISTYLQI